MKERLPTLKLAADTLGATLLKLHIQEISTMRALWPNLNQVDQKAAIERGRLVIEQAVAVAVRQVASIGFTAFAADLESMTVKDGIKLSLTVGKEAARVEELVERVGHGAVIVLTNIDEYVGGMAHAVKAMPDEPELPLGEFVEGDAPAPDPGTPEMDAPKGPNEAVEQMPVSDPETAPAAAPTQLIPPGEL